METTLDCKLLTTIKLSSAAQIFPSRIYTTVNIVGGRQEGQFPYTLQGHWAPSKRGGAYKRGELLQKCCYNTHTAFWTEVH